MTSATRMGDSERTPRQRVADAQARLRELGRSAPLELAVRTTYADEIAKLKMQLVTYRSFIELHGLEPPDQEGEDLLRMWRNCEAVIRAAHECITSLGPSAELLNGKWRK